MFVAGFDIFSYKSSAKVGFRVRVTVRVSNCGSGVADSADALLVSPYRSRRCVNWALSVKSTTAYMR